MLTHAISVFNIANIGGFGEFDEFTGTVPVFAGRAISGFIRYCLTGMINVNFATLLCKQINYYDLLGTILDRLITNDEFII